MAPSRLIAVLLALAGALSMAAAQPPPPPPPAPANGTCNPLELHVCSNLLSGLLGGIFPGGGGADAQCCSLLGVLPGVNAAVCLCNALRDTNILGGIIPNLNVPLALRLVLGRCGPGVPAGFNCA
jgi:hypothetical protein